MKNGAKSFFAKHKYLFFGLILSLLLLLVVCSGAITFARYSSSGFGVGQSVLAQYKLFLTPFQSGNIVAKYDSSNAVINCSYGFSVQNYVADNISQISYDYSIYFIVPQDLQDCLDSASLVILDENYVETSQSYSFFQSGTYVENGTTFYIYKSDYSNHFVAGQRCSSQYSVNFVLTTSNISADSSGTYKKFENIKVQAYAAQSL